MWNYLSTLRARIDRWCFLYELNTQLSICEPWEKRFINCLLLVILVTVSFACYAYLPGYVRTLMYFVTPVKVMEQFQGGPFADQGTEIVKNLL